MKSRTPASESETPASHPTLAFKRIVCGVDFSPLSITALLAAADLARSVNADLHILHVIEGAEAERVGAQALEQKAMAAMEVLLTRWAKELEGIQVTTEISTGLGSDELLNQVRDATRDLLVVGAKGVTLLEDAFVGSTAERVVREAGCSVLVVRDRSRTT